MEATGIRNKIGGNRPGQMFSSRRGGLAVAAIAALLAGLLLFLFVQKYKKSVNGSTTATPVFVARGFIPRGTPASVIASGQLLQRTAVAESKVQAGAIADPSLVKGQVAVNDIYPGQQLRAIDFTRANVTIASELTGTARAVAVPVDSPHGLVGFVHSGDHVDVLASFSGAGSGARGAVTTLVQGALVLSSGGGGGGGVVGGNNNNNVIVLRVTDKVAEQLAFAADNGKVWVTLRPPTGALQSVATNPKAGH
jgi:Flp pilus assembly protein CpaB